MDPISNADRVIALLRQRLLQKSKSGSAARKDAKRSVQNPSPTGLESVQKMAGIDGIDDHQLGRALIQSLLVDELGSELLNESKFQQVVDKVVETIEAEPNGHKLISRLVGELRASSR